MGPRAFSLSVRFYAGSSYSSMSHGQQLQTLGTNVQSSIEIAIKVIACRHVYHSFSIPPAYPLAALLVRPNLRVYTVGIA